jgi:pantoate--beta-alanine ligase
MDVVQTIADCRAARAQYQRMALVPTMGALHAGHMSLVEVAHQHAQRVAVSIFVNPTQFGPHEDLTQYPRPLDADLEKCRIAGVDLVFHPTPQEMYHPELPEIVVDLPALSSVLEGKHRPGHFRGVCQVVAKLFNILTPTLACFGQKDFQQLRILSAMTQALDWPIQIVACPTLREDDGLALSSRNQYLSPDQRQRALSISRGLFAAQRELQSGLKQTNRLVATIQKPMLEQHLNIDYVAAVDTQSLRPVETVSAPTLLAVAARVGPVRLIDNIIVG